MRAVVLSPLWAKAAVAGCPCGQTRRQCAGRAGDLLRYATPAAIRRWMSPWAAGSHAAGLWGDGTSALPFPLPRCPRLGRHAGSVSLSRPCPSPVPVPLLSLSLSRSCPCPGTRGPRRQPDGPAGPAPSTATPQNVPHTRCQLGHFVKVRGFIILPRNIPCWSVCFLLFYFSSHLCSSWLSLIFLSPPQFLSGTLYITLTLNTFCISAVPRGESLCSCPWPGAAAVVSISW